MRFNHIALFLPQDTPFYRRIFQFLADAFNRLNVNISGQCGFLPDEQLRLWLKQVKPDAIFEMNRVKDEVPVLYEFNIPHVTWIVDFQGRTEEHIKGSEITYFFDPGWDTNYSTGGLQDWLPPGTCQQTFRPLAYNHNVEVMFNFIGHIPKPWSEQELYRKVGGTNIAFRDLLGQYEQALQNTKHQIKTHHDLKNIIDALVAPYSQAGDTQILESWYYDLMERSKRLKNRAELLGFALKKTDSIAIYGSENWKQWHAYRKFYRRFIDCPYEMNKIHQNSQINLHDGVSFHFRAIDCLASGGLLFWYDNNEITGGRGLHDYFDDGLHYYAFGSDNFDEIHHEAINSLERRKRVVAEVQQLIAAKHTWVCRADKILNDLAEI